MRLGRGDFAEAEVLLQPGGTKGTDSGQSSAVGGVAPCASERRDLAINHCNSGTWRRNLSPSSGTDAGLVRLDNLSELIGYWGQITTLLVR